MNRHLRQALVATAALTAGLLMTACQNGTDDSSSGKSPADAASPVAVTGKESDSKDAEGVSGSFKNGKVSYLAPGKYIVSVPGREDQQFWVADDTEIMGYDDICDAVNTGPGGEGGVECTEAQLETAARKGFSAEVEISNGIATTITDDH